MCVSLCVIALFPRLIRAEEVEIQVIVQKANVRANADLTSEIVTQVSLGMVFRSDLREGNWFRIYLPPDEQGVRRTAFIHSSMVEVISQKTELPKEKSQPEVKKDQPLQKVQPLQPMRTKAPRKGGIEFGLRLKGGASFFLFGRHDFNRHFQGRNDYWADFKSVSSITSLSLDYKEIKSGTDFSGEFFFNFTPQIGIGLSIGFVKMGGRENGLTAIEENTEDITLQMKETPKITAIPILLTFYFGIPAGHFMDIVVFAGGGFYMGTVVYDSLTYLQVGSLWAQEDITWKAKANAPGFHGGLGFAFHLGRCLDLAFDISGRFVKFTGLTADTDWVTTSNVAPEESGTDNNETLWFFEFEDFGNWYGQVSLDDTEPSGSNRRGVEEAVLGLSGLSLQLGIKVKLNKLFNR
jgi:hypothetical protein